MTDMADVYVMFESKPAFASAPDIPQHGGMLDFNCMGIAGCGSCGWRGVATIEGGTRSTFCPACESPPVALRVAAVLPVLNLEDYDGPDHLRLVAEIRERILAGQPAARAIPKVGRNDPCPCDSGRKYKKCHGAAA